MLLDFKERSLYLTDVYFNLHLNIYVMKSLDLLLLIRRDPSDIGSFSNIFSRVMTTADDMGNS